MLKFCVKCGNDLNCGKNVWKCGGSQNVCVRRMEENVLKLCKNVEVVKLC